MSRKLEQYRRGADECAAKAALASTQEIRDLWLTIAQSYGKLLAREQRIEAEARRPLNAVAL